MTREDIQEYLDCNGFEALTAFDGTKYYNEKTVISIALEVVKNCSIPDVVGQSEQLPCGDLVKHNFSLSKIGRCITCDRSKDKAR